MASRYPYYMGLARAVITNSHLFGMPFNQTTMASELKKGGYATHAVGKWDLGIHKWEYTPTYWGFDSFYGYYDAFEDYFTHRAGAEVSNEEQPSWLNGIDFINDTKPVTDKAGCYSTNLFTEAV